MKKSATISVAMATFNEEDNIKRCLDSVAKWVDEIVIVDGQSTDHTVSLARSYPHVRIISTPNLQMFHVNKQMAIDACKFDWILQLDTDEVISDDLKNIIIKTINRNPSENGFWINRQNFFLGKFLTKGGIYPDPTIRLYRRGFGSLPCKDVHEQANIIGKVGHLHSDLLHYSDPTFSRYLLRNDRYTSLLAADLQSKNITINFGNFLKYFIFLPTYWFFLAYIVHRGYVDGFPGFVFAWYSSLRFPLAYIKLFELSHDLKI
jgi:glycosyltransferase involved in cell wall biosynthesis